MTRMRLHAYVCESGKVRQVNDLGTVEFVDVFNQRPDRCRYAVVQEVGRQDFTVFDLYDAQIVDGQDPTNPRAISMLLPGKHEYHPTLDAAIMATGLCYE